MAKRGRPKKNKEVKENVKQAEKQNSVAGNEEEQKKSSGESQQTQQPVNIGGKSDSLPAKENVGAEDNAENSKSNGEGGDVSSKELRPGQGDEKQQKPQAESKGGVHKYTEPEVLKPDPRFKMFRCYPCEYNFLQPRDIDSTFCPRCTRGVSVWKDDPSEF